MRAIEDIQDELSRARRALVCADMIEGFARRERETALARARVAALEAELQANVDPVNLQGSGPAPIVPREG